MCSHFSLRIQKVSKCEVEMDVFSSDRERGEISKGGVTWLHGTALFDVMSLPLRGSFAEIANEIAFFGVLPSIRHLSVNLITIDGNITAFHVTSYSKQFMADEIG